MIDPKKADTNSFYTKDSTVTVNLLFMLFMAFIALAAFIIFIYRVVIGSGGVVAARYMELQVIEIKSVTVETS